MRMIGLVLRMVRRMRRGERVWLWVNDWGCEVL